VILTHTIFMCLRDDSIIKRYTNVLFTSLKRDTGNLPVKNPAGNK